MGNLRGVGNGAPVRLVSPAPVLINGANGAQAAAAANNMRLLSNQVNHEVYLLIYLFFLNIQFCFLNVVKCVGKYYQYYFES